MNENQKAMTELPEALPRLAVRALILNPENEVLLIQGRDSKNPENTWWFTPGGGIEVGETPEQALRREILEETGITIYDAVPLGRERTSKFRFENTDYFQQESFYLVKVHDIEQVSLNLTEIEKRTFLNQRWWSIDELSASSEIFYPANLLTWLEEIIR